MLHGVESKMKTQRVFSLLLAWAVLSGAGCRQAEVSKVPAAADSDVVAFVAGQPIRVEALQHELARRHQPGAATEVSTEQKLAAIDKLVGQEAIYAQARAAGFEQTPEMQRLIRQLVISHFKEQRFPTTNVVVETKEIEVAYEAEKSRYALPAAVRSAAIFVSRPFAASAEKVAEVRKKAEEILHAARGTTNAESFSALAVRHSEHQLSRYRGGDLGWLARGGGGADAALVEALFAVPVPGEFAPLIETPQGFYIARLTEKREAGFKPIESVRSTIRQQLSREKAERAELDFYASMRAGLAIQIFRDRVEAVPAPPTVPLREGPVVSQSSTSERARKPLRPEVLSTN